MEQTSNLSKAVPLIVASLQPRFAIDVIECEECVKVKVMDGNVLQCRIAFNKYKDDETGGNGFIISAPDYSPLEKGKDCLLQLLEAFDRQGIRS